MGPRQPILDPLTGSSLVAWPAGAEPQLAAQWLKRVKPGAWPKVGLGLGPGLLY